MMSHMQSETVFYNRERFFQAGKNERRRKAAAFLSGRLFLRKFITSFTAACRLNNIWLCISCAGYAQEAEKADKTGRTLVFTLGVHLGIYNTVINVTVE